MPHSKWNPRKFTLETFRLFILLAVVITSNASALRPKRNTVGEVVPPSNHQQNVGITASPSTNIVPDANSISMENQELEQAANAAELEMAMEVDAITEPSTSLLISTQASGLDETSPMSIASQSTESPHTNETTTTVETLFSSVKYADVTPIPVASTTVNNNSANLATKTAAVTTASPGSTQPIAIVTPNSDDSLETTTLWQEAEVDTTTTEDNANTQTFLLNANDSEVVATISSNDTGETTVVYESIDAQMQTTTMIAVETTDVNTNQPSYDTTSPDIRDETTTKSEESEFGSTLTSPDSMSNEIPTTTGSFAEPANQPETETTFKSDKDDTTTADVITTTFSAFEQAETEKPNYDVTINEIKSNSSLEEQLIKNQIEPRHKFVDDQDEPKETIPPATTPTAITSTSLRIKTTKAHKFVESSDLIRTNDVETLHPVNQTVAGTGVAAANSIENTLEAGQIDDSVINKIDNRDNIAQVTDKREALKMLNSTPTISDIIIPSTASIERNRVEDIDEVSSTSEQPMRVGTSTQLLPTTEKEQNAIPSSIVPVTNEELNTTENLIDITTKRIERSTSTPVAIPAATTTTQFIMNMTTSTSNNFVPLSVAPIDREFDSTTVAAGGYIAATNRDESTTSKQHNTSADNKFMASTTVETAISPETTSNAIIGGIGSTVESSDSNAIVTRIGGGETVRVSAFVPSTTPLSNFKPPVTKPRLKPAITKETPVTTTTMNITHIVSTEPTEEYSMQPGINHTGALDPLNPHHVGSPLIPSTATTTEFSASETTEDGAASAASDETDYNVIIAISVSVVGIVTLILLVGFLYVMRKRQKSISYGQRCRPVSLDAYSLDNVSIFNSVRRKGALRASKRSYGNAAFDDPSLKHNSMSIHELAKFVDRRMTIFEEFKDIPQITARSDEVPPGCEDKNRYANVIPLPETRVMLSRMGDDEKTEYINANYVRGPKDPANYYIACQAPLESTVIDFWRMIWEQNSRVIIMATDLIENGAEKCAEYIPASMTLDNYAAYGDFQITLKSREVKEKYAVSSLQVKNVAVNRSREITHFWYQWPETGVPNDEASVIAMLLEARSYLKMGTPEQSDDDATDIKSADNNGSSSSLEKTKPHSKNQGPLTVHCSSGTGRSGTIIACDMAIRGLEMPKRIIDVPQFVYYVRRGRASAVQTKEQYEFIYKVAHMYATKISGPINDN